MNKKTAPHGLGRGLGALLGEIDDVTEKVTNEEEQASDGVIEVSLSDIDVNREQPRKSFDEAELNELADSIKSVGVIQPIVLAKRNGRYTIIVGERRFRASRMAGKTTIPAIIRDYDELTRLKTALIENLQRSDLNPIEEAAGVKTLMDKCGCTQEEIAPIVGKSRPAVANSLRLLNLPESVKTLLINGSLSAGHGRALVSVSPARQEKLANLTVQQGWSVRQLERICAQPEKEEEPDKPKKKQPKTPEIKQLEKMARDAFGVRAKIDGDENKGKLIVTYSSAEELEGIWNVLGSINGEAD